MDISKKTKILLEFGEAGPGDITVLSNNDNIEVGVVDHSIKEKHFDVSFKDEEGNVQAVVDVDGFCGFLDTTVYSDMVMDTIMSTIEAVIEREDSDE